MKITSVKFNSSGQQVIGVGSSKQYVKIGDPCDTAWGGGKVISIDYDPPSGSLLIRKNGRFERTAAQERVTQPSFDVAMVPMVNVSCACGDEEVALPEGKLIAKPTAEDEKEALVANERAKAEANSQGKDPPPAQPVQKQNNQGNQQRR